MSHDLLWWWWVAAVRMNEITAHTFSYCFKLFPRVKISDLWWCPDSNSGTSFIFTELSSTEAQPAFILFFHSHYFSWFCLLNSSLNTHTIFISCSFALKWQKLKIIFHCWPVITQSTMYRAILSSFIIALHNFLINRALHSAATKTKPSTMRKCVNRTFARINHDFLPL